MKVTKRQAREIQDLKRLRDEEIEPYRHSAAHELE